MPCAPLARAEEAGLARLTEGQGPGGWTLGVHRVPGSTCQSVCGVGDGAGRQEREALPWKERIGVWTGVKALERDILAGMRRCPLLAAAFSTVLIIIIFSPCKSQLPHPLTL